MRAGVGRFPHAARRGAEIRNIRVRGIRGESRDPPGPRRRPSIRVRETVYLLRRSWPFRIPRRTGRDRAAAAGDSFCAVPACTSHAVTSCTRARGKPQLRGTSLQCSRRSRMRYRQPSSRRLRALDDDRRHPFVRGRRAARNESSLSQDAVSSSFELAAGCRRPGPAPADPFRTVSVCAQAPVTATTVNSTTMELGARRFPATDPHRRTRYGGYRSCGSSLTTPRPSPPTAGLSAAGDIVKDWSPRPVFGSPKPGAVHGLT